MAVEAGRGGLQLLRVRVGERVDPRALLANNDSAKLFAAIGDLVETGPTRTNVNDFRAIFLPAPVGR